jgi:hypothetical protein
MTDYVTSNQKSMGNIEEINSIQKEIEFYTKNIEHEKINLRLAKERHQKQYENLIKLPSTHEGPAWSSYQGNRLNLSLIWKI